LSGFINGILTPDYIVVGTYLAGGWDPIGGHTAISLDGTNFYGLYPPNADLNSPLPGDLRLESGPGGLGEPTFVTVIHVSSKQVKAIRAFLKRPLPPWRLNSNCSNFARSFLLAAGVLPQTNGLLPWDLLVELELRGYFTVRREH